MAKTIWCAGEDTSGGPPVWAPLLGVVGSLTGGFMWMYEVALDNDRTLHVYKHRNTRRCLHLDTERNAWAYQHRHGRSMYRKVDLADALTEAFAGWDRLACGPTSEERGLIAQAISSARNLHDRSDPLTNPDAGCLLCDELYQNDRLLVNEIDRGAAVDG